MPTGMGVRGTVSRCYGFFTDFVDCKKEALQDMKATGTSDKECHLLREDYFECLHGVKEARRISQVLAEQKKQLAEAK